jgi:HK97 family phage major capsid protein
MPTPLISADLARDAKNRAQKILDSAKADNGRELTDEETEVFNKLISEAEEHNKKAEREARVKALEDRLKTPVNIVPKEEHVDIGNNRAEKEKFHSFGEMLTAVKNYYSPNPEYDPRLSGKAVSNTMSVAVASEGGFMVGAEFEAMLMEGIRREAQLFPRIRMLPVGENKNGVTLPAVAESSRADGYRFGGVVATWVPESTGVTAGQPAFREVDIKLSKLLAFCQMTDELMQDARLMETFVRDSYAEEVGYKLDDSILNGSGKGLPLGILNCPALVTVAKESGQTSDTVVYENITKMWSRLRARSKPFAVWVINQEVEPELFSMVLTVGTGGVPVYMPAGGISGAQYGTLFGRPVITVEQSPKLGDVGDILLVDFRDYIGIDKGGLQVDSSIHILFDTDQNKFRFRYRFNGTPYTVAPLTSAKNSSFTTSPYVTLAAR